ncbi:unnamed protein product [Caenorhabditis auriculariae]|uniref:Uncharacterized protein n=1 Tax=Caenorhabditis auriculariae TaxID=2777116 RepID=A0A8S1H1A4_9PELO|nr:unnamed protein product [Caenorhabditis auriculariae]
MCAPSDGLQTPPLLATKKELQKTEKCTFCVSSFSKSSTTSFISTGVVTSVPFPPLSLLASLSSGIWLRSAEIVLMWTENLSKAALVR